MYIVWNQAQNTSKRSFGTKVNNTNSLPKKARAKKTVYMFTDLIRMFQQEFHRQKYCQLNKLRYYNRQMLATEKGPP